jgi:hypothetical protein
MPLERAHELTRHNLEILLMLKKTFHVTEAQRQQLRGRIERWLGIGRSTQPLDREEATDVIRMIYRACGRQQPEVLFFSSPLTCLLAWAALQAPGVRMRGKLTEPLASGFHERCSTWIRQEMESRDELTVLGEMGVLLKPFDESLAHLGYLVRRQLKSDIDGFAQDRGQGRTLMGPLQQQLARIMGRHAGLSIEAEIRTRLAGILTQLESNSGDGAWSCGPAALYDAVIELAVCHTELDRNVLKLWLRQGDGCHWWLPYEGLVLVSDRPTVLTVDWRGHLHSEQGPALQYGDGYCVYAWHGVRVAARTIIAPGSITLDEIDRAMWDTEVLIMRYGYKRYLRDTGARMIHEDSQGRLWQIKRNPRLRMVELKSPMPNPDGSVQPSLLLVPAEITTAGEAVQWAIKQNLECRDASVARFKGAANFLDTSGLPGCAPDPLALP